MPGIYLFGWDSGSSSWVKIECDASGKLKIDPTLILENPPTEDEALKAPTSEWAFDHDADASAHHVATVASDLNHQDLAARGASDHHTKYTDLEAQTSCNLNGTLYWSCPGIHFDGIYPDVNDVTKTAGSGKIRANTDTITLVGSVDLPDGATVTGAIVYGNAAAEAETWTLHRATLAAAAVGTLATSVINTEDTTINNAVIDNSIYFYYFRTTSLDTNDEIYGARITYTL